MPTDKARVQILLDDETNNLLALLALKYNKSVSATAASLIREALETHEDLYLSNVTNKRIIEETDIKKIPHDKAWE